MKNIFKIFKTDINGLFRNFLALVVAIGLCLLPALYAWFNIYANWDPYANTGNIDIAVVNLDNGYTNRENENINIGNNLVNSLKEKDTIHWVFFDTREEAINGIESGKYYAAVVIDSDFSYSMYNGLFDEIENPHLTYYVNGKKNAVATKITDSAVSSIQASVNKSFISVLAEKIFTGIYDATDQLEEKDSVNKFIGKLEEVSNKLSEYDNLIDSFISGNVEMQGSISDTQKDITDSKEKLEASENKLNDAQKEIIATKKSFNDFNKEVNSALNEIKASLDQINKDIKDAKLENDVKALESDIQNILTDINKIIGNLDDIENSVDDILSSVSTDSAKLLQASISNMKQIAIQLQTLIKNEDFSKNISASLKTVQDTIDLYSGLIENLTKIYNDEVAPQMNELLDGMEVILASAEKMLNSLGSTSTTINELFEGFTGNIDTLNTSLGELKIIFTNSKDKIDNVLNLLKDATDEEKLSIILNFMTGNPEKLGDFFAEPVLVDSHYIYEIKNYGSGVAPFYTTLAIWVGMTILVSLIKVHARKEGLIKVSHTELYFGRYLLFFAMSQIQTAIIVIGDLYLLKIQCLHPFMFWFASAMTSLTFSILIYSLTIAFGDIGKALAVVIMVIQIAGSGGTYPIESLPGFFQAVYIFFPFPYAINAMRECIGGTYKSDYCIYIMQLSFFIIAALVIGLIIRIPFIRLNHFIEERMEDTEMM